MVADAMHPHVNIDAATTSQYVSVQRVRYDFPKYFRSRARMSEWKDLGPFLRDRLGFRPEY